MGQRDSDSRCNKIASSSSNMELVVAKCSLNRPPRLPSEKERRGSVVGRRDNDSRSIEVASSKSAVEPVLQKCSEIRVLRKVSDGGRSG